MKLMALVGLVSAFFNLYANECRLNNDNSNYRTRKVKVDDVVFHLHFPETKNWFSQKVIDVLKEEVSIANEYFKTRPKTDVHLVIETASESNGMATVFPYNIITLYDFPPLGKSYLGGTTQWIRNLVIHEYIHILTMDMTSRWIDSLRSLFGSSVKTNGIIPSWLSEGTAVWYESLKPQQGRLNQRGVKYQVYQALIDPLFCLTLSCLDSPAVYPYGNAPYWVGGTFIKFLEDRHPGFLSCVFKKHSSSLPFLLNDIFETCGHQSPEVEFKKFRESYLNNYDDQKTKCPATPEECKLLKENNISESTIDFERGLCQTKSSLFFVTRKRAGRHRLIIPHEYTQINLQTGKIKEHKSNYPIVALIENDKGCMIKSSQQQACSEQFLYSQIDAQGEPTLLLGKSAAVDIIADEEGIIEIFYNDGAWTFKRNNREYVLTRSENYPKFKKEDIVKKLTASKNLRKDNIKQDRAAPYDGFRYLVPEYFLLDYSNFANLSAINLNTTLSDPVRSHGLGISLTKYFTGQDDNLWGGFISYVNNTKASTSIRMSYAKSFYVSSLIDEIASSDTLTLGLRNYHFWTQWKYSHVLTLENQNRNDFISKREVRSLSLGQNWDWVSNKLYREVNKTNLNFKLTQFQAIEPAQSFLGTELHAQQEFFLADQTAWGYSLNYGQMFKEDFKAGYLAAGGVNNFFGSGYNFPLYMVPFADLLGNEIFTSSFYLGTVVKNHFRGYGMFPFFLKDSGFQTGIEYAKGQYLFIGDTVYKDEYANGVYFKYYFNTKLFYIWDSTLSFAISQMQYPAKLTRLFFLFDAASF